MLPAGLRQRFEREWWRALAAVFVIGCAVFWAWYARLLADAEADWSFVTVDLFVYFYPMLEVGFSRLREGELFLWNPWQMGGMPGLATLQAGFLYPLHLAFLFLPTAEAMGAMVLLHGWIGAVAMLLFLRTLGVGWCAAGCAALYFAMVVVLPLFVWPPAMEAMAWLPLGLACVHRIVVRGSRRAVFGLALAVALPLLAGGYQTAVGMFYAYGFYFLLASVRRNPREPGVLRPRARAGFLCAMGVGLGLALAAPQVLPTLELSQLGFRTPSALPASRAAPYGGSWQTISVFLQTLFSTTPELSEFRSHLGILAFGVSIVGLFASRGPRLFSVGCFLFGLLSLFAPDWFLQLRTFLPVLAWFRIPSREFVLAQLGVTLLLAFGLDLLWRQPREGWWRFLPVTVGLTAAGWVCWIAGRTGTPADLALFGGAAVSMICVVGMAGSSTRRVAMAALSALLLIDTMGSTTNRLAVPYAASAWRGLYDLGDVYRAAQDAAGFDRSLLAGPLMAKVQHKTATKNAMLFRTSSPFDYDPLVVPGLRGCLDQPGFFANTPSGTTRLIEADFSGSPVTTLDLLTTDAHRCLDLASVRVVAVRSATLRTLELRGGFVPTGRTDLRDRDGTAYTLLRNENALPRAFGVHRAECLPDDATRWRRMLEPGFDPSSVVLLDSRECSNAPLEAPGTGRPDVVFVESEPERVELRAQFEHPGFVVLNDTWFPGWTASVDGAPVEILKANSVARAVRVPAGGSSIVFRYEPWSFSLGQWVATIAGLILLAFCWGRSGVKLGTAPE